MKHPELPKYPCQVASEIFPDNLVLLCSFLMQPIYGKDVFEPEKKNTKKFSKNIPHLYGCDFHFCGKNFCTLYYIYRKEGIQSC